jgi:hypothetical protein
MRGANQATGTGRMQQGLMNLMEGRSLPATDGRTEAMPRLGRRAMAHVLRRNTGAKVVPGTRSSLISG